MSGLSFHSTELETMTQVLLELLLNLKLEASDYVLVALR